MTPDERRKGPEKLNLAVETRPLVEDQKLPATKPLIDSGSSPRLLGRPSTTPPLLVLTVQTLISRFRVEGRRVLSPHAILIGSEALDCHPPARIPPEYHPGTQGCLVCKKDHLLTIKVSPGFNHE